MLKMQLYYMFRKIEFKIAISITMSYVLATYFYYFNYFNIYLYIKKDWKKSEIFLFFLRARRVRRGAADLLTLSILFWAFLI